MKRPPLADDTVKIVVRAGTSTATDPVKFDADNRSESKFSRVKRMFSETILMGRVRSKKKDKRRQKVGQEPVDYHSSSDCDKDDQSISNNKRALDGNGDDVKRDNVNLRKRKERQDSFNSTVQEYKLIRSNSEERPVTAVEDDVTRGIKDMRRVSSHENVINHKAEPRKNRSSRHDDHQKRKSKPQTSGQSFVSRLLNDLEVTSFNGATIRADYHSLSPNRDPKVEFFIEQQTPCCLDNNVHEIQRMSERHSRPLSATRKDYNTNARGGRSPRLHHGNDSEKKKRKQRKTSRERSRERRFDRELKVEKNNERVGNVTSNECIDGDVHFSSDDANRTDESPCLELDLTNLHEQLEGNDPIPICSDHLFTVSDQEELGDSLSLYSPRSAISSPRNSFILTRKVYLDPHVAKTQSKLEKSNKENLGGSNPVDARIKQINKILSSSKRKIKEFNEQFEMIYGRKPTHYDRMDDQKIRNLTMEVTKLKKELKCLKNNEIGVVKPAVFASDASGFDESRLRGANPQTLTETLEEIQKRLVEKRQENNFSNDINDFTIDQLMEEKVSVQKALLLLESIHGRPVSKEDRDLARPLYDHYRVVKRMVARITALKTNSSIGELATIHEHETMNFVSLPVQESIEQVTESDSISNIAQLSTDSSGESSTDTSSIRDNFHSLPLNELTDQERIMREEKKRLRRLLKEYEYEFQLKTGRKLQKDERTPMAGVYTCYKQVKARLKLLDALIAKKRRSNA